ncbi:hypothetical protein [Candidatus Enterococcus mangumiae]|uniref:DUF443 family protein n=1 Tax=Candidatus Enterococcus mangumiae TaxID=2230878 RepID=A0ABZ2SW32_9ENTE|nr:hypothetical protein [Enterococcus sp. DIV1094]MBO0490273.1 hypothetical protein [Enterococcus sp. DIV1094]
MIENNCVQDIKRINGRYYLLELHDGLYIVDYFKLIRLRNFFPFSNFYNNARKKSWIAYKVTGLEEIIEGEKIPERQFYVPESYGIFGVIVISPFLIYLGYLESIYLALLIGSLLSTYGIVSICRLLHSNKKVQEIVKDTTIVQLVLVENTKSKIYVVLSNFLSCVYGMFVSYLFISAILSGDFWVVIFVSLVSPTISLIFGKIISNLGEVPDVSSKYQIEKR